MNLSTLRPAEGSKQSDNFRRGRGHDSKEIVAINVDKLNKFDDGAVVTVAALLEAGVISNPKDGVKILGNGELTKKLTVQVNAFSKSAAEKIEALGGKAEVV